MTKDKDTKNRLISALLTLLLGGAIVTTLVVSNLHYEYPPKDASMMQKMQDPIEFGGDEYVDIQDLLAQADGASANEDDMEQEETEENATEQPSEQPAEAESGQNELEDQGTVNEPPQPSVSTNKDSPMKEPVQPKKTTKPQTESSVNATETKRKGNNNSNTPKNTTPEKTASQKKAERDVVFNNGGGGNGEGSVNATLEGFGNGYTLEKFPKEPCKGNPGETVIVLVEVGIDGNVVEGSAKIVGGTNKNEETRQKCLKFARGSRFRIPKNTTLSKTGKIIYTIKK